MLGLKIHYVKQYFAKQFILKRNLKVKKRMIEAWRTFKLGSSNEKQRLERLAFIISARFAIFQIKSYIQHKSKKQRQKLKVLRFWSYQTKQKVLQALKLNIDWRSKARENAFKVYIHEQKRLTAMGMSAFKKNILQNRTNKLNRFKAFKFLSKLYKRKAFTCLSMGKSINYYLKWLIDQEMSLRQKVNRQLARGVIYEWRRINEEKKNINEVLVNTLEKVLTLRKGFYALREEMDQQQQEEAYFKIQKVFSELKSYTLHQKRLKQIFCTVNYHRQQSLKKLLISALVMNAQYSKQQKSQFQSLLHSLKLRQVFNQIRSYSEQRSILPLTLKSIANSKIQEALIQIKSHSLFRKRQARNNAQKQALIRLLQSKQDRDQSSMAERCFNVWKDYSQQDKRQLKLLARAVKHRNRHLKSKIFSMFISLAFPSETILPGRQKSLKQKIFSVLQQNKMKKLVKKHKYAKARKHWEAQLKCKYFQILHRECATMALESQELKKKELTVSVFRKMKLLNKSLQGFKLVAYRERVRKYLVYLRFRRYGLQLLINMREKQIKQRTKGYKLLKAERYYQQSLLSKAFENWKQGRLARQMESFKENKAYNFRIVKLMTTALSSLWQMSQKGQVKRQLEQQAFENRVKEQLQGSLLKMMQVSMYWAAIKGRFGSKGRLYLAMKYGGRWRMKTLMRQQQRLKSQYPTQVRQTPRVPSQVSNAVSIKLKQQQAPSPPHQLSNTSRITSRTSEIQSRIKDIEKELTIFKNKKLLYRELESQLKESTNETVNTLLKSKLQSLKTELQQLQPIMKDLLSEITTLKQHALLKTSSNQTFNLSQTLMSAYKYQ